MAIHRQRPGAASPRMIITPKITKARMMVMPINDAVRRAWPSSISICRVIFHYRKPVITPRSANRVNFCFVAIHRLAFDCRTRRTSEREIPNVRAIAAGATPALNDARMRFALPSGI